MDYDQCDRIRCGKQLTAPFLFHAISQLLSRYLSKASDTSAGLSKLKGNATPDSRSLFIKQHDVVVANPFLETSSVVDSHESRNNSPGQRRVDEQFTCDVYKMIDEVMADGNTANSFTRVASDSTLKVLFPWVARLLVVMEKLPVIVEDISAVFANLCDLYFTTVFRICAGNATNERLLLGIEMPAQPSLDFDSRETMSLPEKGKPSSSPSLFGFRRRSSSGSIASSRRKSSLPKVEIPTCLDGDICSPHPSEVSGLEYTRAFVQRAQKSLQDIVMLDKVDQWITDPTIVGAKPGENEKIVAQAIRNLELRLGAAYSCLMISTVLDVTCKVATDKLSKSALGRQFIEDLSTLEHYAKAVFQMVPKLVRICSKVSCVRAILAKRVVLEVSLCGNFHPIVLPAEKKNI